MSVTQERVQRRIDSIPIGVRNHWDYCAERRLQMVKLMCAGKSCKQIGHMLGSSPHNVSCQIRKFMRERGINTHAQLGIWMLIECKL